MEQCRICELDIRPIKQLSQEDIEKISEHMSTEQVCEECMLSVLGQIEYP